jgi:hypothetical protein
MPNIVKVLGALCLLVLLWWIVRVIEAERVCPIHSSCTGPQADAWMGPFTLGFLGLPAAVGLLILFIFEVTRRLTEKN